MKKLIEFFKDFDIDVSLVKTLEGPTITQYQIKPGTGVKITRITALTDDLSLALAAKVRIIAPIPGTSLIGIDVPNKERKFVNITEVGYDDSMELSFPIGKDPRGNNFQIDITTTPHLLIAGATGTGKSVTLNSLITSLISKYSPKELGMIMIDPKKVELTTFKNIPHLLADVITEPSQVSGILDFLTGEMESRYKLLEKNEARNIKEYNFYNENEPLPYIVTIIDEFADIILQSRKEVETQINRLAAMARAVGIHLILATQRPSVDVITGTIKSNFPSRIAFKVSSAVDSRTILDRGGAESLLGKGDLLYQSSTSSELVRLQASFADDSYIEKVIEKYKGVPARKSVSATSRAVSGIDEAIEFVARKNKISLSAIQSGLSVKKDIAENIFNELIELDCITPTGVVEIRDWEEIV